MSKKKSKNIKLNNNAKKRKKTSKKLKMNKSVFLYGNPNVEKRNLLKQQQDDYTNAINFYISVLYDIHNYDIDTYISILNNTTKSPKLRELEKILRPKTNLKSALSQAAFDEAINKVSNQFVSIKNQMYSIEKNPFTSSNMLYTMILYDYSKEEMYQKVKSVKEVNENELHYLLINQNILKEDKQKEKVKRIKKLQSNISFYKELLSYLNTLFYSEFNYKVLEFNLWYRVINDSFKQPYCKKTEVQLISTTCKLQKTNDIKAPYIIEIINSKENKRILIPLNTSCRCLKRLEKYEVGTSMKYTIRKDGTIKITVPIQKEITTSKEIFEYLGVDTGISDMFHTSNDIAIGSCFSNEVFYKDFVEPALAEINKLKIKKKKLKDYLHKHKKDLSDEQIKQHLDKINHIETNIRQNKKSKKLLNKYHNQTEQLINQSCNKYIDYLKKQKNSKSIMTVLELLDMKEFNKSKTTNSMHSMFVRGQLQKRLMEKLNWNGFNFMEVDPAFTSKVCPICNNLSEKNRNGKTFKCICCGYTDDADHVGGINIKNRATDEEINTICEEYKYNQHERHKVLKFLYKNRHEVYLKTQESK